jgi:guanine nucleotide-binding protein subunit beta-2-like 1 protein
LNIWDINDLSEPLRQFEAGSTINQISFNPKLQWVSASTENGIRIWDLMSANEKPIADLNAEIKNKESKNKRTKVVPCTSLAWNSVGKRLFAGFTDGLIRVWNVNTD